MNDVVVIGSGNVAESLARALAGSGVHLVQLWARNGARAAEIAAMAGCGWADRPEELAPADLYLLAVSDRAVAEVAGALPFPEGAAVGPANDSSSSCNAGVDASMKIGTSDQSTRRPRVKVCNG